MAFAVLLILLVCVVLLGIGVVLGVALVIASFIAVWVGALSTSAAFALWRRSFSKGLRLFQYEAAIIFCIGPAVFISLIMNEAFEGVLTRGQALLVGITGGTIAGLFLGLIWSWIARKLKEQLGSLSPVPSGPLQSAPEAFNVQKQGKEKEKLTTKE